MVEDPSQSFAMEATVWCHQKVRLKVLLWFLDTLNISESVLWGYSVGKLRTVEFLVKSAAPTLRWLGTSWNLNA